MPSVHPMAPLNEALLRFSTSDPDEWVERMSSIATGLKASQVGSTRMNTEILGARLPDLGMFASTMSNFHVQSAERPYYAATIYLEGSGEFLVGNSLKDMHRTMGHLQRPDRPFDAKVGEAPAQSLQLVFDRAALDSFVAKLEGSADIPVAMVETLDMAKPAVESFARHAAFIWSEILRGGPVLNSPLVAQESSNLLMLLLVEAAKAPETNPKGARLSGNLAGVRKAEEYVAANLSNPTSIADVAVAAGMSARNLSREFSGHHGMTIKGFIKQRRLEAANRRLLTAERGETNVTLVAMDLGFAQLGRFSADYREAFGELPSQTLDR